MIEVRRDRDIHREEGGWFEARWHFSFGGYRDPDRMGVGPLRVFNDDRLIPGAVWPMHPHRDIESNTYVVEGTFAHDDSLGNGGELGPGAAQVMRFSSRGALHSERNGSETDPMRFLQFWILPSETSGESSVQQHQHHRDERTDRWLQIMGPAGEDGLDLVQDARVRVARLTVGSSLEVAVAEPRGAYLYVIDGRVRLADDLLDARDAAVVHGPEQAGITAVDDAELIAVDVPLAFEPAGIWAAR